MRIKTFILVIILSIFLGVVIFIIGNKKFHVEQIVTPKLSAKSNDTTPTPTSTPFPTNPPLPENASLLEETKKLTPDDFSKDFDKLKEEIEGF